MGTCEPAASVSADNANAVNMTALPLLDIATEECWCASPASPATSEAAMVEGNDTSSSSDNENNGELEDDAASDDSELFTINLRCRGSTYEPNLSNLAKLHAVSQDLSKVQIKLSKEVTNLVDRNALAYKAKLNDEYVTIGYVGLHHLPRMHAALSQGSVAVTVTSLRRSYSVIAKKYIYICHCAHTKPGKWQKPNFDNKYNANL